MKACDHADLPPATVITAGFDSFRDQGLAYADRLAEAGVSVTRENFPDMIHGFASMLQEPFDLDAALDAYDLIAATFEPSFSR